MATLGSACGRRPALAGRRPLLSAVHRPCVPMNPHPGRWWHRELDNDTNDSDQSDSHRGGTGKIVCDLCPRQCRIKEGDRGFCFVRKNHKGQMVLDTYGRSTGFCIDPIEKKPLNHFYPGTSVLSFGTAGCNLGCRFCQNWEISKSREVARLSEQASPDAIVTAARELGCHSVAFTYNDPVVWAEYAIDTAQACREAGIKTVAVTAGYIMPEARQEFYQLIDAANVDLKAFSEQFYHRITLSHLGPVLDTLKYLRHETDVWFEITNLIIPDENDSADELKAMCDWIVTELGPDVPVHFTAFHPDFRMTDKQNTPHETLLKAHAIARQAGIHYPYVGNVRDRQHGSTHCHACGELLIDRDWYEIHRYGIVAGCCSACGTPQPGRFSDTAGSWGRRRTLVDMRRFAQQQRPMMASPPAARPMQPSLLDLSSLSADHSRTIQRIAQQVVAAAVLDLPLQESLFAPLGALAQQQVYGLFTTLRRRSHLRGCCGFLGQPLPLRDALILSGRRTARDDHRMPPISGIELPYLGCHVQLLATPALIDGPASSRRDFIEVGRHGLRISGRADGRFANRAGLLLPNVPIEQGWNLEAFLQALCRKAGMPEDAWRDEDTVLERFEGFKISGGFEPGCLPQPIPAATPPGDRQSLMRLHGVAVRQLIALSQGGTPDPQGGAASPDPEAAAAMDGTVNAVILTAYNQDNKAALCHWIETSLRPGVGLQTTLTAMSRVVDQTFRQVRFEGKVNIGIAVSVFHDPADHGITTAADWQGDQLKADLQHCDLRGVDPASRAVLALCGQRTAIAFDATKPVLQLVQEAAAMVRDQQQPISIITLAYLSPINALLAANGAAPPTQAPPHTPSPSTSTRPRPRPDQETIRPPVLADAFYPADGTARAGMVQGFEQQSRVQPTPTTLALLTPHAGLRYSGRIAMDAWRSAPLDRTLVIIGPKHKAAGADWAVSPARAWQLPGGWSVECDRPLAEAIVAGVAGMCYDAATHQHEHAVEVQLPILEQLTRQRPAPPRIVSIAMAAGHWPRIQQAARQLAAVLSSCTPMPLLVISSDLNHFADEAENRRRDGLALTALQSTDPQALLETCRNEQISMCGVAAAALVMETLHCLGQPFEVEQLHYDTSAAVTGDSSRVVGYAACRMLATARR